MCFTDYYGWFIFIYSMCVCVFYARLDSFLLITSHGQAGPSLVSGLVCVRSGVNVDHTKGLTEELTQTLLWT